MTTHIEKRASSPGSAVSVWRNSAVLGTGALLLTAGAIIASPLAGTNIGNQASATYTDASQIQRTATSNTVSTVVQQVAALTLDQTQTKDSAPGGQVVFPHTITNTGNGSDTFNLTAGTPAGTITGLPTATFYADANCDGTPDNATAITSVGPVAPGAKACFVAVTSVPNTATSGNTGNFTVTATSTFDNTKTQNNTDTINVTNNAVVNVVKSMNASSGAPGSGPYTITLTYTNTGNSAATDVEVQDTLPTGMTYVAGSGLWSGSATSLSDPQLDAEPSGVSEYNQSGQKVYLRLASIPPNVSGTLTFKINIAAGTAPGTLNNTGLICYDANGAAAGGMTPSSCTPVTPGTTTSIGSGGNPTNTVPFTVTPQSNVDLTDKAIDPNGNPVPNGSSTTDTTPGDGNVTQNPYPQGSTVPFDNVVYNKGTGTDTFDMTYVNGTFPTGTTFMFFKSDGVTPLTDTNGNGIPDTGPVAAGAVYHVFLKATLPNNASGNNGGIGFTVDKTGTSTVDPTKKDTMSDILPSITANTVDLEGKGTLNNAANGDGPGTTTVIDTNTAKPGTTTTFPIKVQNTSGVADTYNLFADKDNTFGTSNDLPAGWTVTFLQDTSGTHDCSSTGSVVTNTGIINANAVGYFCAVVSVPAGTAANPTGQDMYFNIVSPTSGATDYLRDLVKVDTVRDVNIQANQSGQIYPGGSVVYSHIITNKGNVPEGVNAGEITLASAMSGVTSGWSNVIYWDKNNDGVLDANDPQVTDLSNLTGGTNGASTAAGLDVGESARFFVKVLAPAGANDGDVNVVTLTATTTNTANGIAPPPAVNVTDTSTVKAGQVRLIKLQALDAACDGTADTAYGQNQITTGAKPGACIRYQITATNEGTANVSCVVINDATPANTTYTNTVAASITGATATVSVPGGNGAPSTVSTTATPPVGTTCAAGNGFTLIPNQSAVLEFGVKIDP